MYFQIEISPDKIKRGPRKKVVTEEDAQEECARLVLAPFCKPPQVVFDNVLIGTTCIKTLEVFNPSKNTQQITLGKTLTPGFVVHFPQEYLDIDPEKCYCVTMAWTPTQQTALRETIRFTNNNRGRYDVIVVLKSVTSIPGKNNQGKRKISPGKIKKKSGKRSPVAMHKKKIEAIYNKTVHKTVNHVQSTQYKVVHSTDKEHITSTNDYSMDSNFQKFPFDSMTNLDFNLSEVFSNKLHQKGMHDTYDKSYKTMCDENSQTIYKNVLKPSNIQVTSATDIFDNLTFTPLKSAPTKNDKLNKAPKIIISANSESDLDDSVDNKNNNKENEMFSFTSATSDLQSMKPLNAPTFSIQYNETPLSIKKIPNTSSPKDVNSLNFSINTDCSRISDMSFFPHRVSTERKIMPNKNYEAHDIINDSNFNPKLSSDTYTKESPVTSLDYINNDAPFANDPYSKMCRQALFIEQKLTDHRQLTNSNYLSRPEHYPWHNDLHKDVRSPPRSLTPPLQSIPEESAQLSDIQILDRTDKHFATFTINRTFDKTSNPFSMPLNRRSSWSKRAPRSESTLRNVSVPVTKETTKSKATVKNKESLIKSKPSIHHRESYLNYVENVYSQSFTVDPFLSSTYFYDKDEVKNYETAFKRWLNCILTPPADLDTNVEPHIDVGKVWIENRNKEVPLAPTKEQVCSKYHNSHRLDSLRRSARALLYSNDMSQVLAKLNAQVDKKLIAIRNDRNLHLDIGLQKIIMEILLSYNPLWLRIGLEATYGVILPLKSNNDVEGLTTFVIQRMFKNPNLKNKNSKGAVPNKLLPAYMEAIKKFTLKKFFVLVFFLDQAKQKKLIPHDPCLFRRNALYKESKDIIINFTRELIGGIGDITRHLRPLGYVVSHKQTYVDEYIYAVNNIAEDLRDGVRLTKVMEIILMKNGLLHKLRTPPISRLQKIHNVQVALNALKEVQFVINGKISAADIVDGHREKTLSLLWQLIHVFRAPLFEKAANVIQTWWKQKYSVIVEKRRQKEKVRTERNSAAITIQYWWRRIQYHRIVERQMQKNTSATIVIQKFCRMWLCRSRLVRFKRSALKIAEWYKNTKIIREAKDTLCTLRIRREKLRHESATIIQKHFRRWLCMREYKRLKTKVVLIQSIVRRYLVQKRYRCLKKCAIYVQRKFRGKLLMRKEVQNLIDKKNSAILIQSYYRMSKQRKYYMALKKSVQTIEKYYRALILMRNDREYYIKRKQASIKICTWYRCKMLRKEYLRRVYLIVHLQKKIRGHQAMKRDRANFLKIRNATQVIQKHFKAYQMMLSARTQYVSLRNATILIQRSYLSYTQKKSQRSKYLLLKKSVIQIQTRFRSLLLMRCERNAYLKLRDSVLFIQQRYRTLILTRQHKNKYQKLREAALVLQRRYRAFVKMRETRLKYLKIKSACIAIQDAYRSHLKRKQHRLICLKQKESAIKIQNWYRSMQKTNEIKGQFELTKKACVTIQGKYKAFIVARKQRQEYMKIKNAAVCIQMYYKSYTLMRITRSRFIEIRNSTIIIQRFYRSWVETRKQRQTYIRTRQATVLIQTHYRQYQLKRKIQQNLIWNKERENFCRMRHAAVVLQRRYREFKETQRLRKYYMQLRMASIFIQRRVRAKNDLRKKPKLVAIKKIETWFISIKQRDECRSKFIDIKRKIITLQSRFRTHICRKRYLSVRRAAITIQRYYRCFKLAKGVRESYIQTRISIIKLQANCRRLIQRRRFVCLRATVQTGRAIYEFKKYLASVEQIKRQEAVVCIQKYVRRYLALSRYKRLRQKLIFVQNLYRGKLQARPMRCESMKTKLLILKLQAVIRGYLARKDFARRKETLKKLIEEKRRDSAAAKIQALFRGNKARCASRLRVALLRRRWRNGGLHSSQATVRERHEDAMNVLRYHLSDMDHVIRAFKSLEFLTEVFPMMYNVIAASVVKRIYLCMSVMNRSIPSVEVLKSAACILVNLTRYRVTGPKIYERDQITATLKFMWRYSKTETQLICVLATYIWLFSKYDEVKKDLTKFLQIPENHRMLISIKENINSMNRMVINRTKKYSKPSKYNSLSMNQSAWDSLNISHYSNNSLMVPAVEPDYGITHHERPKYFKDAVQALSCLYETYELPSVVATSAT